ncbi:MAG: uracil-DNA glycosylase [Bacteroidales bacterium]|nr:uracil-DNA glycosylase [Bacteroidales bacterium]MBN2757493.1 uracil-DNA glycosylase [Bacteroidales bacterium]
MNIKIEDSWKKLLEDEFEKDYFKNLVEFVKSEYKTQSIYPPGNKIFNAFDFCHLDNLKVVILGQDPYHGKGQANGLCFSVRNGIKKPPSLVNIFKEIKDDLGLEIPESGNLERWAKQGILLLNATLTVRASSPGSHQNKGWEIFTDSLIKKISEQKKDIVFLLWGAYAQKKEELINSSKHYILKSAHPSPFSAHRGFLGNKHFSMTNDFLNKKNIEKISW